MSKHSVYATDETFNHLSEAAASTRHDDMDASTETVLASYALMATYAQQMLHAQVRQARSMGLTWQQIGDAFGMTRQAAQQRFGA